MDIDDLTEEVSREFRKLTAGKRAVMIVVIEDPTARRGVRMRSVIMREDLDDRVNGMPPSEPYLFDTPSLRDALEDVVLSSSPTRQQA